MSSEKFNFYEDDEGIATDMVLSEFGPDEVQCICIESESVDKKMEEYINHLINNQKEFAKIANEEAEKYCIRVYGKQFQDLNLTKVYLFPDEEKTFGFMFSSSIDSEHGIGIKFFEGKMIKIGSGEVAFL